jgi:hypothetical protein
MVITLAIAKLMLAGILYLSLNTLTKIKTRGYKTHLVTFLLISISLVVPILCASGLLEIVAHNLDSKRSQSQNCIVQDCTLCKTLLKDMPPLPPMPSVIELFF